MPEYSTRAATAGLVILDTSNIFWRPLPIQFSDENPFGSSPLTSMASYRKSPR